jgi:prolyl-tRNA editing enzyme YbaK/EbsC (Cys-tRNA(Pro) deacylase)
MVFTTIVYEITRLGLKYEQFNHTEMKTIKDAVEIMQIKFGEGTKSKVAKSGSDIIVITVLDNERVDFKNFQQLFSFKKITFLKETDLIENLGVEIGAVAPLGYERAIKVYIAENVFKSTYLYINPGRNDITFKLSGHDFESLASSMNVVTFKNVTTEKLT